MRKFTWSCAAVAVAAGGFTFGTAEYTRRHPESLVGRCVTAAVRMTSSFGPVFRTGGYLVGTLANATTGNSVDEEICEIPDDPEPIVIAEPEVCPVKEPLAPVTAFADPNRGRLPGKIVIDEGDEPPLAKGDDLLAGLTDRAVEALGKQLGGMTEIVQTSITTESRWMPYCLDEDNPPRIMPRADDAEDLEVKPPANPIWNSFLPKGTEVGGNEESEPRQLSNDCREDPSASLQIPGCPYPASQKCPKQDTGGEEPSEMPPVKKKSKRSEPDKVMKKSYDDARRYPDLMHPAIDTMEFRQSDWGRDDVPLPPF